MGREMLLAGVRVKKRWALWQNKKTSVELLLAAALIVSPREKKRCRGAGLATCPSFISIYREPNGTFGVLVGGSVVVSDVVVGLAMRLQRT